MKLLGLALTLLLSLTAQAQDLNHMIGVRLSDLIKYSTPTGIQGLNQISSQLSRSLPQITARVEKNHGTFLIGAPIQDGLTQRLPLMTVVTNSSSQVYIAKYIAETNLSGTSVIIRDWQVVSGSELRLTGKVSLLDRKAVYTDESLGLKIVMPVGVGSFDEGVMNPGVTTLLTPRFKKAALTAETVISKRAKPRYFDNKPFIRIVDGLTNELTAIGFHTEINDSFYRGFDSHGCMRLRDEDLYLLHDLVKLAQKRIEISVSYRIDDAADHPAPLANRVYKTVLNAGTAENPKMKLDVDDLVQVVYREKAPPVEQLQDEEDDHNKNKYQYEAMDTYVRQRREQAEACQADYDNQMAQVRATARSEREVTKAEKRLSDELDDCKKQGARKLSVKQKIYRWWVH